MSWRLHPRHVAVSLVVAAGQAVAADLPPAPEPVDYVRACKASGDGYFAVPGTETCLSLFGYVQAEYMVFGSNRASHQPGWYSQKQSGTLFRGRYDMFAYATTPTSAGPLNAYVKIEFTQDDDTPLQIDPKEIYLTFADLTAGRRQSFYDFYTGSTLEDFFEPAWSDFQTNLIGYTFGFGHGLTATLALEDAVTRNLGIKLGGRDTRFGPGYGGPIAPDVVANLNLAGDWGTAQVMGAIHRLRTSRPGIDDATGFGVGGGVTFDLPFLGDGDSLTFQGNYALGALAYAANDPVGPGRGFAGADGVVRAGRLKLGRAWSLSTGFTHNWNDRWSSTLEASYLSVDQALSRFSFSNVDVQANVIYTPVRDLQLGIESELKQIGRTGGRADGLSVMTMFVVQKNF